MTDYQVLHEMDYVFAVLGGLASWALIRVIGGDAARWAALFFAMMMFFGTLVILAIT